MPIFIDSPSALTGRTLKSMRDEVISYSFDPTIYQPLVDGWLNEAQGRVSRRMNLMQTETSSTITLVAGISGYALPSTMILLTAVLDASRELTPVARDDVPVIAANGKPRSYAIYGANIVFYPTPQTAATITVRYRSTLADMVADTDAASIPDDYCHILVTYALYKAYRKEDDVQQANNYWAEYERDLRDMRASNQYRDASRSRQIAGMWQTPMAPRAVRP